MTRRRMKRRRRKWTMSWREIKRGRRFYFLAKPVHSFRVRLQKKWPEQRKKLNRLRFFLLRLSTWAVSTISQWLRTVFRTNPAVQWRHHWVVSAARERQAITVTGRPPWTVAAVSLLLQRMVMMIIIIIMTMIMMIMIMTTTVTRMRLLLLQLPLLLLLLLPLLPPSLLLLLKLLQSSPATLYKQLSSLSHFPPTYPVVWILRTQKLVPFRLPHIGIRSFLFKILGLYILRHLPRFRSFQFLSSRFIQFHF